MTDYLESVERLREARPELAAALALYRTLKRLFPWLQSRGQDLAALDLITQDEYCHDLLVPLGPSGEWLAFGMT
jgi:hypothetical protein